jgi:hypothetical protein
MPLTPVFFPLPDPPLTKLLMVMRRWRVSEGRGSAEWSSHDAVVLLDLQAATAFFFPFFFLLCEMMLRERTLPLGI